jgi:hypothetical protein
MIYGSTISRSNECVRMVKFDMEVWQLFPYDYWDLIVKDEVGLKLSFFGR